MKPKNIIPQRYRNQVVRQFVNAKLIRQPNVQHELVGGAAADRASRGLRPGSSPRCERLSAWTAAGECHWPTMKLMRSGLIPS
jgi:hypothetical protein